jgi:Ca-activated chloride channel family protein
MLFPEEAFDLESAVFDSRFGAGPRPTPLEKRKSAEAAKGGAATAREPMKPGSYTGGVVILLSDGRRTTGPDPLDIAKMAADRGVRVYTVGFGTRDGASIDFEGYSFYVRLDEETLKAIARMTGGEYFHAGTAADLRKVYEALNARIALETRETEISALLVAAAVALLLMAALLSLLWFHRGVPVPAAR